jgi:hypothetical protein
MLRRILLVLAVALVIAAMMVALAMPAFAAGGAADNCGPPGQLISDSAKVPGASTPEAFGGPSRTESQGCVRAGPAKNVGRWLVG